jgi:hypothetical protein
MHGFDYKLQESLSCGSFLSFSHLCLCLLTATWSLKDIKSTYFQGLNYKAMATFIKA